MHKSGLKGARCECHSVPGAFGKGRANRFRARLLALTITAADVLAVWSVRARPGGRGHVLISCPAHDDANPSCSVHLATGRTRCFACGFHASDVVALHAALGRFATMGEALRDLEGRLGSTVPRLQWTSAPRRDQPRSDRARGERVVVRTWTYRLADGTPAFEVHRVQFRLADGSWATDAAKGKAEKVYLPSHPGGQARGMPPPFSMGALRPLLNLPALVAADPSMTIYVVEGEPSVDALASVGLLATTSSGGASNSNRTDWTPLAGRRVVVWPDNDPPGLRYAQEVTTQLSALEPVPAVRWVDVEKLGLPPGGDAVDWVGTERGGLR